MKRMTMFLLALLAVFGLAACGGSSSGGNRAGATAGEHNSADVTFAQMMIPHHRQAVEMAGLASTRSSSPEVKRLAEQIRGAQDPEIATMTEWLTSWSEPTSMPHMSGHDMGSMPGMMSDSEMRKLETLTGRDFDRAFLDMMTAHHKGAIEMARTEQSNGKYGPAKDMARSIETGQRAEVDKMRALLQQL